MRIAIVGKGGSGKTLVCGAVARSFARRGHRVLALDTDTLPGLRFALGLPIEKNGDAGLPEDLAERKPKKGWVLKKGVRVRSLVKDHAVQSPDGIRFLQLGKLPDKVKPTSSAAFWHVLKSFNTKGWHMLADMAAGTRQAFFGWSNFADTILIVVEPSAKSVLSAKRLFKLAKRPKSHDKRRTTVQPKVRLVANKLHSADDLQVIRAGLEGLRLPVIGKVPHDENLTALEESGKALFALESATPALVAIEKLADRLLKLSKHPAKIKRRGPVT